VACGVGIEGGIGDAEEAQAVERAARDAPQAADGRPPLVAMVARMSLVTVKITGETPVPPWASLNGLFRYDS